MSSLFNILPLLSDGAGSGGGGIRACCTWSQIKLLGMMTRHFMHVFLVNMIHILNILNLFKSYTSSGPLFWRNTQKKKL